MTSSPVAAEHPVAAGEMPARDQVEALAICAVEPTLVGTGTSRAALV